MARIIITIGALAVGVAHVVWPALTIDAITLALIGIAILPWLAPIIQSIEIPGFGKLELREIKEKAEAALSRTEEVENQMLIDAQALALLERVTKDLSDSGEQPLQELKNKLKGASKSVKVIAFINALNLRRKYKQEPTLAERSIPIFEVLIETDNNEEFHRNHGELGFILKDKKEYQRALKELSKAIEIRDKIGDVGFKAYEFNRAECRIATDNDFARGKQSSSLRVREILADLRIAAEEPYWQEAIKRPRNPTTGERNLVLDWLKLNDIDPDTLEPK